MLEVPQLDLLIFREFMLFWDGQCLANTVYCLSLDLPLGFNDFNLELDLLHFVFLRPEGQKLSDQIFHLFLPPFPEVSHLQCNVGDIITAVEEVGEDNRRLVVFKSLADLVGHIQVVEIRKVETVLDFGSVREDEITQLYRKSLELVGQVHHQVEPNISRSIYFDPVLLLLLFTNHPFVVHHSVLSHCLDHLAVLVLEPWLRISFHDAAVAVALELNDHQVFRRQFFGFQLLAAFTDEGAQLYLNIVFLQRGRLERLVYLLVV